MARRNKLRTKMTAGGKIPFYYAVCIVFAAMYLFGHINQVRVSLRGSSLLNFTNLMMCALGIAEVLIPVWIVLGKDRALKANLYLVGILYLFGNLWFFKWLYIAIQNPSGISFDFAAYQQTWGYMFNHTIWASRNAETLFLNYFCAVTWFSIAKNIDKDKNSTLGSMIMMLIVTFILPIIFFGVTRLRIVPGWWIKKSVTLFISYFSILVIMIIAMKKKTFWNKYICRMRIDINDTERTKHGI